MVFSNFYILTALKIGKILRDLPLQDFRELQSALCMVDDVVVNGTDIIEHLASSRLEHVGSTLALVAVGVDDHVDAFGYNIDIDVGACQYRFAIVVDRSLSRAVDMQMACAEGLDAGTLVERLAEHVDGYLRSLKDIERFHDHHIHQSVAHAGLWGDISIVAVLRCVGTGDKKRFISCRVLIRAKLIGLGLILKAGLQYLLDVCDGATLACLSKLETDEGIESHSAGAEEVVTIDGAIVQVMNLTGVEDLDALLYINRYK